jgi:hypothetical protein
MLARTARADRDLTTISSRSFSSLLLAAEKLHQPGQPEPAGERGTGQEQRTSISTYLLSAALPRCICLYQPGSSVCTLNAVGGLLTGAAEGRSRR